MYKSKNEQAFGASPAIGTLALILQGPCRPPTWPPSKARSERSTRRHGRWYTVAEESPLLSCLRHGRGGYGCWGHHEPPPHIPVPMLIFVLPGRWSAPKQILGWTEVKLPPTDPSRPFLDCRHQTRAQGGPGKFRPGENFRHMGMTRRQGDMTKTQAELMTSHHDTRTRGLFISLSRLRCTPRGGADSSGSPPPSFKPIVIQPNPLQVLWFTQLVSYIATPEKQSPAGCTGLDLVDACDDEKGQHTSTECSCFSSGDP